MSASSFFSTISKTQLYDFFGEFDATEESVKRDVATLKEWIRKQPHLPEIEDDLWLTNYLLKCKNSLERAKASIDGYFTTKTLMPEVFQNRDPCSEEMTSVFRMCGVSPCPKLTSDGYRIVTFSIFDNPQNAIPPKEHFVKMVQINWDLFLKLDPNRGIIMIHYMRNVTPAFVAMLMLVVKKFMNLTTKTVPNRYPKVYVVNASPYMETLIKFVKSILSKKLSDRLQVWNDEAANLVNILPKEVLPADFGGDEKPLAELAALWYEEVKKHREWLVASETQVADLDKKPNHARENDNKTEYGVDGSFRKLAVD